MILGATQLDNPKFACGLENNNNTLLQILRNSLGAQKACTKILLHRKNVCKIRILQGGNEFKRMHIIICTI